MYTYSWYVKNDSRKNRHANTSALPTIPVTCNSYRVNNALVGKHFVVHYHRSNSRTKSEDDTNDLEIDGLTFQQVSHFKYPWVQIEKMYKLCTRKN